MAAKSAVVALVGATGMGKTSLLQKIIATNALRKPVEVRAVAAAVHPDFRILSRNILAAA
jgi:hypothetical protein